MTEYDEKITKKLKKDKRGTDKKEKKEMISNEETVENVSEKTLQQRE